MSDTYLFAVGASSLTVGFFQRIPFSIFLSSVKTRRSKVWTVILNYACHANWPKICLVWRLLVWFYVTCLLSLSPRLECSIFTPHSFTVITSNVQITICILLLKHLFVSLLCISVPQSHSSVVKAAISNYRKVYICASCMSSFSCEALAATRLIWYHGCLVFTITGNRWRPSSQTPFHNDFWVPSGIALLFRTAYIVAHSVSVTCLTLLSILHFLPCCLGQ